MGAQSIQMLGEHTDAERIEDILCQVNRIVMRPSELERPAAQVVKQQPLAARRQSAKEEGKKDLEDVFNGFTPRLREISDKQDLEYHVAEATRATTPTGVV